MLLRVPVFVKIPLSVISFKSLVAVPGASITVQTYGDFLNFNPHLHAIVSDGCFLKDSSFQAAPVFMLEDLGEAFKYEVLKMLKKEGKINDAIIENMLSWHHSWFNVYIGDRIEPDDKTGLGNLARYIIRACFSQVRLIYIPAKNSDDGVAKIIYTSKDGKSRKVFNALDWLARLVTHIPGRYEHTVRYYGHFSNKSRGMRKKADTDDAIPTIVPNEMSSKEARQNWDSLIQKIYEVDPLVCPKCQCQMKIISIIDDFEIIDKILKHLNLWDIRNHDPSEKEPVYIPESIYTEDSDYDNSGSQIPPHYFFILFFCLCNQIPFPGIVWRQEVQYFSYNRKTPVSTCLLHIWLAHCSYRLSQSVDS